jgi:hypothetical protein
MNVWRVLRLLPALGVLTLTAAACQAIAGIEDRSYDPQTLASPECQAYCDQIMQYCTAQSGQQQYETRETCLGICAHIDPGSSLEPGTGNTLACRSAQLASAQGEPETYCVAAGPSGGNKCGTDCESFCSLQAAICPPGEANCVALCAGLDDSLKFNVTDDQHDSLACRIYHVSAASVLPDPHCGHATLRPNGPCVDADGTAPDCKKFCKLEMTVCTDANTVYASEAECEAVCGALTPGSTNDHTQNTAGCRFYHSYNAVAQPDIHCSHTGPGGDGHCGPDDPTAGKGNCISYCQIMGVACAGQFDATQCIANCNTLAGSTMDSLYTLATSNTGNTVQCRLNHAASALLDPTQCSAALGNAPCN